MDNFDQLIKSISPIQIAFVPVNQPVEIHTKCSPSPHPTPPHPPSLPVKETLEHQIFKRYHLDEPEIAKTEILCGGRNYNLYTSFLYLLSQQYRMSLTYEQQMEFIERLIRFLIYKLETDLSTKSYLEQNKLKVTQLIDQITNKYFQSDSVVHYLSFVFGLNILVLYETAPKVKRYSNDATYDTCKPHIILFQNEQKVYNPVVYDGLTLLNYYDHQLIGLLGGTCGSPHSPPPSSR